MKVGAAFNAARHCPCLTSKEDQITVMLPIRRSPRWKDYDYSQEGAYFVTICTHQREWLFGEVANGEMHLSPSGEIAQQTWTELASHYPTVELDESVVMPNHVHGILVIKRAGFNPAPTHGLSEIVRGYKSLVTRQINAHYQVPGSVVWQRSYYDHIIRNEASLNAIRQYVLTNPERWEQDQLYREQKM